MFIFVKIVERLEFVLVVMVVHFNNNTVKKLNLEYFINFTISRQKRHSIVADRLVV